MPSREYFVNYDLRYCIYCSLSKLMFWLYLGCTSTLDLFLKEYQEAIIPHTNISDSFILEGDFNINILTINQKRTFQQFYDAMTDLYLLPNITFPTRFENRSATLIDEIVTKLCTTCEIKQSGI